MATTSSPRPGMTRSTVKRLLETNVSVPESKTTKRGGPIDDVSRGWALVWSTSDTYDPYVGWRNGTAAHLRSTTDEQATLTAALLDEVVAVLTEAGYRTVRERAVVLITGRVQ